MMEKIKPCPFCGCDEVEVKLRVGVEPWPKSWWFICYTCGLDVGSEYIQEEDRAIARYNDRRHWSKRPKGV